MPRALIRLLLCCCSLLPLALSTRSAGAQGVSVTRATLANGLQVVVVHDPLAPVVTAVMNYRVGSDEQSLPGLAHATEHMMFRGSATLSSSSFMDVVSMTGGNFDADTRNDVTQYYFTVPARYLDIALRLERARATGLSMAQSQWNQERLAITQEVTQDNSNAIYRLFTKMSQRMLAGTPYAHNTLGTIRAFAREINRPQLLSFYRTWYHPNNAVYVIAGDVDGPSTIAAVRRIFGDVPAAPLPRRPTVRLRPLTAVTYRESSDLPVTVVMLGYRMPGYRSPDYAAGQILGDVLASQRSALYELVARGKMLYTTFQADSYARTSIGVVFGVVPVTANVQDAAAEMRAAIDRYRRSGVPRDLVAAAKRREIAQREFSRSSVQSLAFDWSDALAVQGLQAPDDAIAAFGRVTEADVNRVLRSDLAASRTVSAYAVPHNAGAPSMGSSGLAAETNRIAPTSHAQLPPWARNILAHPRVPAQTLSPASFTLANGLRVVIQPETSSHSVTLSGTIRNDPQVQEPAGEDGVAGVTSALLPYGTTTYSRLGYQTALDAIAADVNTGTDFSLRVLASDFDRGVALLADDELHPALSTADFAIVKRQEAQALVGEANSPDHLTDVALADALYPPGDPARRFATAASVDALTLDDVRNWYAAAYRPDLTTIVIVGDVGPQHARSVIERYFGAWRSVGPKPRTEPPPVGLNMPSAIVIPATGRVQSSVTLDETSGFGRTSSDWAALQVANTVLTGGFYSSLLYHDVREVHGYAYAVGSSMDARPTRSSVTITYACDPKNILPAQALVVRDLLQLQSRPLSADRLMLAKALLMGRVPILEASYDGVAAQLLDDASRGLPLDQNLIDARAELRATASQVQAAVRRWIRPRDFVRVVTGPGPGPGE
ncbi:MAG TPA: pitrilysin family protein [Candidatus Dormibacteraeota bacterium]|nr:pitrilysin family protein [Candidatus Dormibacteraeota bacterium]